MLAINTKTEGDFGYIATYKGKRISLYAPTSYDAQQRAAVHFKAKKSYDVTVLVAEDADGTAIIHTPT